MKDWLERLDKDLSDFIEDLSRLSVSTKKDTKLKSLRPLTTFYATTEEARKAKDKEKEDPIQAYVDKRIKEIFG
jgi:hypothetical protein